MIKNTYLSVVGGLMISSSVYGAGGLVNGTLSGGGAAQSLLSSAIIVTNAVTNILALPNTHQLWVSGVTNVLCLGLYTWKGDGYLDGNYRGPGGVGMFTNQPAWTNVNGMMIWLDSNGNDFTNAGGAGTISCSTASPTITLAGATFNPNFFGDIWSGTTDLGTISSVDDATHITLDANATATLSGASWFQTWNQSFGLYGYVLCAKAFDHGGLNTYYDDLSAPQYSTIPNNPGLGYWMPTNQWVSFLGPGQLYASYVANGGPTPFVTWGTNYVTNVCQRLSSTYTNGVISVDPVNGSDVLGSVGGYPFQSVIVAQQFSKGGETWHFYPGISPLNDFCWSPANATVQCDPGAIIEQPDLIYPLYRIVPMGTFSMTGGEIYQPIYLNCPGPIMGQGSGASNYCAFNGVTFLTSFGCWQDQDRTVNAAHNYNSFTVIFNGCNLSGGSYNIELQNTNLTAYITGTVDNIEPWDYPPGVPLGIMAGCRTFVSGSTFVNWTSSAQGFRNVAQANGTNYNLYWSGNNVADMTPGNKTWFTTLNGGTIYFAGNTYPTNVFDLSGDYRSSENTNHVGQFSGLLSGIFSGNFGTLTNVSLTGATNATSPANSATVRAWVNWTNATGGVFKMPLYQ